MLRCSASSRRRRWPAGTRLFVPHGALVGVDSLVELHDGPVRGIATLFPRNVNTMVTCALATVGLDRCRGVLVADPTLDVAVAEVHAVGHHGEELMTVRRQPIIGVSGTEMVESMFGSILKAAGSRPGVVLV